jgi:hypothetical protein
MCYVNCQLELKDMARIKKFAMLGLILVAVGCLLIPTQAVLAEFGIDPGKVFVDNLFPGAQAEVKLTVFNQGTNEVTYRAVPRLPDYTADDYEPLTHLDWVSVEPEIFSVKGGSKESVLITILMPEDMDYSGKKAEVWISVKETGSEEMIQVELASRILISTRDDNAAVPTETPAPTPTPTETPEPTKPGDIVISTPEPEPPAETGNSRSLLGPILGGLAGVVIVAEGIYYFTKKRKRGKA